MGLPGYQDQEAVAQYSTHVLPWFLEALDVASKKARRAILDYYLGAEPSVGVVTTRRHTQAIVDYKAGRRREMPRGVIEPGGHSENFLGQIDAQRIEGTRPS